MKVFITVLALIVGVGASVPHASAQGSWRERVAEWREWYRNRGVGCEGGDVGDEEIVAIETAAISISQAIGKEAGEDQEQFIDYSRRLALTLNQKSNSDLVVILGTSNTLGLGQ